MKISYSQKHLLNDVKDLFNRTSNTNPTALALEKKGLIEAERYDGFSIYWRLTERGREFVNS